MATPEEKHVGVFVCLQHDGQMRTLVAFHDVYNILSRERVGAVIFFTLLYRLLPPVYVRISPRSRFLSL